MEKLDFCKITVSSYNVARGANFKSVNLAGGHSRNRKNFEGAVHTVGVQLYFDSAGSFQYFNVVFARDVIDSGSPFEIKLQIDGIECEDYIATFIPNSISYGAEIPSGRFVSAQLEVRAKPFDQSEYDTLKMMKDYNFENPLEYAVNEAWPNE